MAWCVFGAKPLSKAMLGDFYWTLRNKLQWNFNQNTKLFIHENASENIVCKMAAILSRGRWVKNLPSHRKKKVHILIWQSEHYLWVYMNWSLLISILSLFGKGHDYCKWVWSCKIYESTIPTITSWHLKYHYKNLISPLVIHEQMWYVSHDLPPRKTFPQYQYSELTSPDVNTS